MEEKTEERYYRADTNGGYLYNKSEIDYFKQTQSIDVMANLMLGDFNSKGSYVLTKGIINQLVKMKKIYQYSFGTTTFCQSASDVNGYGKIDFAVKMRNNAQNGTVSATLQVLETIDRANGYYQNTNTASIAVYTAPESNTYIVDMLKYFNIVSKKDEGFLKKDKEDEEIDLIIARKNFMEQLKKSALPIIDEQNKQLYDKRLKLLVKSTIGKKILEEFNKESYKINGWFVKEGMPGYYRYLNQILDGLIELHSAEVLQDVALKAAWNKANENFSVIIFETMKLGPQQILIQQQLAKEQGKKMPEENKVQNKVPQKPKEDVKLKLEEQNQEEHKKIEDIKKDAEKNAKQKNTNIKTAETNLQKNKKNEKSAENLLKELRAEQVADEMIID